MTKAVIDMRTTHEGRVEIRGHAGDALVCAGISTLTGAVLNAMGDAARNVVYESGDVSFDVRMEDGMQMGALETLINGLMMLEEKFPRGVGVTLKGPPDLY